MDDVLNYAGPESTAPLRFWRTMVVGLVVCPVFAMGSAAVGCWLGLGRDWREPGNAGAAVLYGLLFGALGGLAVVGLAHVHRSRARLIIALGAVLVIGGSGGLMFVVGRMAAAS